MKTLMSLLLLLATAGWAVAHQAPFAKQDVSISSHEPVYPGDQTSTTAHSSRRWAIASCATPCRQGRSCPPGRPRSSCRACPSPAHPMRPFAIDAQGGLYVSLRSAINACQVQNRLPHSPGYRPRTEPETQAGIWRYDADRTGQRFSPAERFVTGLRNTGGIAFDAAGRIFATRHGRSRAPMSRRKSWSSWSVAPTMAGRIAITT
jgi:glucose/arabinose dehydrogenase